MNQLCLLIRASAMCLGATLLSGPAAAFDLLRPVDESFPPGIGISDVDATKEGPPEADDPSFEDQLIELVNQERWANGQLAPLKRVDLLDNSSETHSANMAIRNFVMHCDPDTLTQPWDRMVAAGYIYSSAGENISLGVPEPRRGDGRLDVEFGPPRQHPFNHLPRDGQRLLQPDGRPGQRPPNLDDGVHAEYLQRGPLFPLLDARTSASAIRSILWSSTARRISPRAAMSPSISMEAGPRCG